MVDLSHRFALLETGEIEPLYYKNGDPRDAYEDEDGKFYLCHDVFILRFLASSSEAGRCGECDHLVEGRYHDRMLRKCEVYGLTHSEASDWAKRWAACGLKNKETAHQNVIRLVRAEAKEPSEQLDGQVGLEISYEK